MSRFISDIKKYYRYTIYAAKSELKAEVANSYLNWLWWILDPLLFMLVYTFISTIVFGTTEKYFPVFVFIGLTTWTFFNKTVLTSVKLVRSNRAIVSKVYIPKFVLVIEKMCVNAFKMFISFLLVLVMMFCYRVPVTAKILYFFPLILCLFVITFGISLIFLHFGVFVEDLSNIMNVLLRLMFYLSGIFYSIEKRVPAPYGDLLLTCNPIANIMNDLRRVMLYGQMPHRKLILLWTIVGAIISIIGLRIVYKNENSYVKVI